MAAGVGKTYRMLQEGRAEQEAGRDVVIGYLEPHGRAETEAQAEGLERLPRRQVDYRGTAARGDGPAGDLPARPRALPDRRARAHQRARGSSTRKRYEDIDDVLDAGIDVFSTVNVQHLETLNDRVAELTGVRVRETFPDSVLASADEVVLIDLTPEALIERLREGKIYPRRARRGRAQQLLPDREPGHAARAGAAPGRGGGRGEAARSRVAEAARHARASDRGRAPPAVGERAAGARHAAARARSGWCGGPGARRSGSAPTSTCSTCSRPVTPPRGEEREQLEALRRLASVLGAQLVVEEGDDVAEAAAAGRAERGTTYVLIGQPRAADRLAPPARSRCPSG